ncbi:hypothetical protein A9Q86_01965 [Flavobacteriales bacterium 33_180_T64]|nr:hypothetical protein A9Q86_01965 [Flavobacteriales bacterium 33_180_T64]
MKKIIFAIALLVTTVTIAQNNLFSNISTTDQYQEYWRAWDAEGDGTYEIGNKRYVVKFVLKYLPTGEGYSYAAIVDEGNDKDKSVENGNAVDGYNLCTGYPHESVMTHKYDKDGIVAIDDYVFILRGVSKDGTSFEGIDKVFIKKATGSSKSNSGKKKKMSFKERFKALKNNAKGVKDYGEAHKTLQSKNLDKLITEYLVAMKVKQNGRSAAEKKGDKNITAAKNRGDEEIKRYNDSIKATPKYQKMKAHQRRMKQMDNNNSKQSVTIYNKTGKDIYIYKDGSRNGTRINVNSSAKVDCSSNYTYKFDSNSGGSGSSCYNANTGCDRSVTIN